MSQENETQGNDVQAKKPQAENVGMHAVLREISSGQVENLQCKTRTELARLLSSSYPEHEILGIFKGKKMNIREKKSFKII